MRPDYPSKHLQLAQPESPFTRIEVNREELLDSSFRAFALLRPTDLLKPLRIRYAGEDGIDR